MALHGDICIVGSGPVGMAVALRLANQGARVTVVDGGGPGVAAPGAEFHCGQVLSAAGASDCTDSTLIDEGTLYIQPDYLSRTRYRGTSGSGWQWGVKARSGGIESVRLVVGSAEDFAPRPQFDIPGWETPASEIMSRYDDALTFFGLEGQTFDVDRYRDDLQPAKLPTDMLATKLFHFGQARMIRHERLEDMRQHPLITLTSGLNVVGIKTGTDRSKVESLVVADMAGNESTVEADQFIFAMGGIENTRQLLLAAEDGTIEDTHDVFGRWFMDHPHFRFGFLTPTAPIEDFSWYDFQEVNGTAILRGHELASDVADKEDILRFSIDLVGRHPLDATKAGHGLAEAFDAVRSKDNGQVLRALPALLRSPVAATKLATDLRGGPVHNTAFGGWSDPELRRYPIETLGIEAMFEQRPSRDNRIRLGDKVDRFGRRIPNLYWSWSQVEIDSIQKATAFVEDAFRKADLGTYTPLSELGQGQVPRAGSGAHHLGGTRQSARPEDGVVNKHNRMHGIENLSLVGSSVFPTSIGYANPTLTAIADGLRVADHLTSAV